MAKRLEFDVQLVVDDSITTDEAAELLQAVLEDMEQSDDYHEVMLVSEVQLRDESVTRLLDILDTLDDRAVDRAIDSLDALEETSDE